MNTTKRGVALAVGTCGLLAAAGCSGATVTKTVASTSAAAAPSSPAERSAPAAGGKTMYDTQYPSIEIGRASCRERV